MYCKKSIIVMISILMLFILSGSVILNSLAAGDMTTYSNDEYGYSLKYPKDWEIIKGSILMLQGPMIDGFFVNVNVAVEHLPSEVSVGEYAETSEQMMEDFFSEYEKEDQYSSTVNGEPCVVRLYTLSYMEINTKQKQIYFVKDSDAFVITCSAAPSAFDYADDEYFEPIVNSFELTAGDEDSSLLLWIILISVLLVVLISGIVIGLILWMRKGKKEDVHMQHRYSPPPSFDHRTYDHRAYDDRMYRHR